MKWILGSVVTFGVLSMLALPAFARVAAIETAVALADDSEPAVDAAVAEALDTVARGARAMGLTHLKLTRAAIVEHTVVIGVLATDTPATSEPDATPSPDESARPSPHGPSGESAPPISHDDPSSGTTESPRAPGMEI
jgi:hypothetical protein